MNNAAISDTFELVADLLEFQGANPFRVRAYRTGAHTIRALAESVSSLIDEQEVDLTSMAGIGKDLAAKCQELVATGRLGMLEELREQVPESVLQLVRISGLGPKKAATLHRELGIVNLEQLRAACEDGGIRKLKGFGVKTEAAILAGIDSAAASGNRMRWADTDALVQELLTYLRDDAAIQQVTAAGSYRRGRETVGDIDILAVADNADAAMDRFASFPGIESLLARGGTKMTVRARNRLQIDLRVVPPESFGAALQYFTGSKEHNVELRRRARQRGMKINEYGVYRLSHEKEQYLAGATEADVYAALDLPCFPPELREGRHEFDWAARGALPVLIEESDLRGDLHMHTTASDGKASLREMAEAARAKGHSYIAITDHSPRVSMANGLKPARLRSQWQEINALDDQFGPEFLILKGVECDILESGQMDLPDDVLAEADWVLASIHYGQQQPRAQITDRMLAALAHPHISAIAHPTGRLIGVRAAYDVDMDAILAETAKNGKFLELNANPYRLDLHDMHCAAAKERGILIVINSDAHSCEGLKVQRYGILQARRGGLTAADVANTRTWPRLRAALGRSSRQP